jgi:hypothetical protein
MAMPLSCLDGEIGVDELMHVQHAYVCHDSIYATPHHSQGYAQTTPTVKAWEIIGNVTWWVGPPVCKPKEKLKQLILRRRE